MEWSASSFHVCSVNNALWIAKGKGKGTPYLTSEVPLLSRESILPGSRRCAYFTPSFHQCSVLRVFKAT